MKGGMYQPVNYAADALAGFKGVQDIFTQQAQDERLKQQMELEQEKLDMQRETHALDVKKKGLEVAAAETDAADLQAFRDATKQRALSGIVPTKDPEQIKGLIASIGTLGSAGDTLKGLLADLKNPEIPLGNPIQASSAMIEGTNIPAAADPSTGSVAAMAPQVDQNGVTHWRIPTVYAPEQFTQFDQAARQAYPGRFDVTHDDGQGNKYKLGGINAVNLTSDGRMSVDYQTIDVATGQVIPGKIVPITDGKSNSPDDNVKQVGIEDYQKNLAFKHSAYQLALDMGISTTEAADFIVNRLLPAKSQEKIAEHSATKGIDVNANLNQKRGEMDLAAETELKANPIINKFTWNDIATKSTDQHMVDMENYLKANDPEGLKAFQDPKTNNYIRKDVDVRRAAVIKQTREEGKDAREERKTAATERNAAANEKKADAMFNRIVSGEKDNTLTKEDAAILKGVQQKYDRKSKTKDALIKSLENSFGKSREGKEAELAKLETELAELEAKENAFWSRRGKGDASPAETPAAKPSARGMFDGSVLGGAIHHNPVAEGIDVAAPYRAENNRQPQATGITANDKGNSVTVNGKTYKKNTDGTVTIDGTKYKVQG